MKKKNIFAIVISSLLVLLLSTSIIASAHAASLITNNYSIYQIASLKTTSLSFEENISNVSNNKVVQKYTDAKNNNFFYINDKLVGFILENPIKVFNTSSGNNLTSKDVNSLKLEFKSLIDLNDYKLDRNVYDEALQTNYLTFYKYINGYKTSDFVEISLDNNGNIIAYAAPNKNDFNTTNYNISKISIDETKMEKKLVSTLDTKYGVDKYNYHISDSLINICNDKIEYIMFVEIENHEGIKCGEIFAFNNDFVE